MVAAIEDFYRRAAQALARDGFEVAEGATVLLTSVGANIHAKDRGEWRWVYLGEAVAHRALLGTLGFSSIDQILADWRA